MGDLPEREFGRVLDPVDPWLEPALGDARAEHFRGRHETMSVAALFECPPPLVLASFYGPAGYQMPVVPHYFRFTEHDAAAAEAKLQSVPSVPPWPPEYSDAHHDLTGDQLGIARAMVRYHDANADRAVAVPRLAVLDQLASLLSRPDLHERFAKAGWKRIRGLLKLAVEREETWVPLALAHGHILDDPYTQGEFRKLYNSHRAEWTRVATLVHRIREDPAFSGGASKHS